ncbi:MAG: hypothetical protein P1V81_18550 [Planctomycetota bacterium]|nr:hypothetical protein [Planctomycetota bacterium]
MTMTCNTRLIAPLALSLALACGSDAPPTTAHLAPMLKEADSARLAGDWDKAGESFDALVEALGEDGEPELKLRATRGSIQAQAASDAPGALGRAMELVGELGGAEAAGVDLIGGLAADFKTAGARTEATVLARLALETFPEDPGIRNLADRLGAAPAVPKTPAAPE